MPRFYRLRTKLIRCERCDARKPPSAFARRVTGTVRHPARLRQLQDTLVLTQGVRLVRAVQSAVSPLTTVRLDAVRKVLDRFST